MTNADTQTERAETALALVTQQDFAEIVALPTGAVIADRLQAIRQFQSLVKQHFADGHDYGVIPGTQKPTLLLPGAQKILRLFSPPLFEQYTVVPHEDWEKPLFAYRVTCRLFIVGTSYQVSEGVGSCSTMEDKYRWRKAAITCPDCRQQTVIKGKAEYGGGWLCFKKQGGCGAKWPDGTKAIESQPRGRVLNDDLYTTQNTVLKMAKKRALVDAALSVGRLADVFTQDMEDITPDPEERGEAAPAVSPPAQRPATAPGSPPQRRSAPPTAPDTYDPPQEAAVAPKPMTFDDFKVAVLSLQLSDDETRRRLGGQAVAALRAAGESYEQIYARIAGGPA